MPAVEARTMGLTRLTAEIFSTAMVKSVSAAKTAAHPSMPPAAMEIVGTTPEISVSFFMMEA